MVSKQKVYCALKMNVIGIYAIITVQYTTKIYFLAFTSFFDCLLAVIYSCSISGKSSGSGGTNK